MDIILTYILLIGYIGFMIYAANQAERNAKNENYSEELDIYSKQFVIVQSMLYFVTIVTALFSTLSIIAMISLPEFSSVVKINTMDALVGMVFAVGFGVISLSLIRSYSFRQKLANFIGTQGAYDPNSIVHTVAGVLVLLMLTTQIIQFIVSGGTAALIEDIEQSGVNPSGMIFQTALQVAASFLGIGYAIRRSGHSSLKRLGLRIPTSDDIKYGVGGGFAMIALLYSFGIVMTIIQSLLGTTAIEDANAANVALSSAFATLPMALLVSLCASIGEEILFRGALQPIFGNLLTTIVFALLHTQSLFAVGIILLFVISLILGWIRNRTSTTAAIIAHFIYNFTQLLLLIVAIESGVI
jgi:membrane protease YdiL (CAAX protease family)